MSKVIPCRFLLLMMLPLSLISGCDSPSIPSPPASNMEQEPPTQTPTVEILVDCFNYFHLFAWEDMNGNGIRETGELPLQDVQISVSGYYAHSVAGGRGTTDAQGLLTIDTWAPGECAGNFEIQAVSPEGYLPSTETILKVGQDQTSLEFEFGFYPVFAE